MSDRDETTSLVSSDDRSGHRRHVKYVHTINKLQSELAVMEETLKKVKATDVTLLLQHLRENKIDIKNLQARNSEYKERISALEMQLLEAHYKAKHVHILESHEVSQYEYDIDSLPLEEKCAKMELIIASYDTKMQKLKTKLQELEEQQAQKPKFKTENSMYTNTNGHHRHHESKEDFVKAIEEARAADKATLHELSLEVEHLSTTLELKNTLLDQSATREEELKEQIELLRAEIAAKTNKTGEKTRKKKETQVSILYSFICGMLFVVICNVLLSVVREWTSRRNSVQEDLDVD